MLTGSLIPLHNTLFLAHSQLSETYLNNAAAASTAPETQTTQAIADIPPAVSLHEAYPNGESLI